MSNSSDSDWTSSATDGHRPFKTKMCHFFPSGTCARGSECSFAHGVEDKVQATASMHRPAFSDSSSDLSEETMACVRAEVEDLRARVEMHRRWFSAQQWHFNQLAHAMRQDHERLWAAIQHRDRQLAEHHMRLAPGGSEVVARSRAPVTEHVFGGFRDGCMWSCSPSTDVRETV